MNKVPKYTKHSEEIRQKIVELKSQGIKDQDIADRLGIKFSYVRKICRKLGLKAPPGTRSKNRPNKISKELVEVASKLREEGFLLPEIAQKMGVTHNQAMVLVRKTGVKLSKDQWSDIRTSLNPSIENAVMELRKDNNSLDEISDKLGIKFSTTKYILNKHGYNVLNEKIKSTGCSNFEEYVQHLALQREGRHIGKYDGINGETLWLCKNNHEFKSTPGRVRRGAWCPICVNIVSKAEIELINFIRSIIPNEEVEGSNRKIIAPKEIDIYIPSRKIAIEYCGLYWHGELNSLSSTRHLEKMLLCNRQGIRLITIFEDEWIFKKEQVKAYLKSILGIWDYSVGARKCFVKQADISEVSDFLKENHIQGSSGSVAYSLVFKNQIVGVMTFRKSSPRRFGPPEEGFWELTRYCLLPGYRIFGGFKKLLNKFISDYSPKTIVSFSDNRWSIGGVYLNNGFVKSGMTKPSYTYFNKNQKGLRIHKSNFRKDLIISKFGDRIKIEPEDTEWTLMKKAGYDRIWDCGLTKWIL